MVSGRHPLPFHVVEATGAIDDPNINRTRQVAEGIGRPIGPPPEHLEGDHREIWEELTRYMWWLREHHQHMFELYVRLIVRMRNGDTSSELISGIMRCSGVLGGDPRNDQRFAQPGRQKDDHLD